ncbi:MAG: FAD-dependent oxidoreductase [Actinobacteria bacterium]|nr:FAD-dependent oxidoreductase [Actinomycetota bacterium]
MRSAVDVIVVGLGPIGAGALRRVAAAGASCVGIGQAEPPSLPDHTGVFASHYDSGRVTRHVDARFEWAELARRAIADYPHLEATSGIAFHHPSSVLYSTDDPATIEAIELVARGLAMHGIAIERLTAAGDDRIALPDGVAVFAEGPPAGHVDPRRLIAAQLATAERAGAEVVRAIVTHLAHDGRGWHVSLDDGRSMTAERVVLAGGPHTDELVGALRPPPSGVPELSVRGETVVTAVLDEDELARLEGLPAVLSPVDHPAFADVYAVPPTAYPDGTVRLKLGATRHAPFRLDDREARTAWMRGDRHTRELDDLRRLTEALVPGLRALRWETKPCLLTDTPTDLPYVDHLADGLVIAAGCNGYAAKSGDAIGAVAAELLLTGRWVDTVLEARAFRLGG